MKAFINKISLILLMTAMAAGCGGGGGDGDSAPIIGPLTITGASGNQVALDGRWSAGCQLNDDGNMEEGVTTISGSSFSVTTNTWGGAVDCLGSPSMRVDFSGTFALGQEVTVLLNGSLVTATKTDIVVITAFATIFDANLIPFANIENWCGVTGWVVNTAKEVVGTDCDPGDKDITYIDDTIDPNLMYGGLEEDEGGTLDADGYPTVLDADSAEARLSDYPVPVPVPGPVLTIPVSDTGQTTCYTSNGDVIDPCPSPGEDFYGQDASYTINPPFYTKLDSGGNELPDSASDWTMVKDKITGLIWEVKTDNGSIHDKDNKYTWYAAEDVFVEQLNSDNFGGYNDWRIPTIKELTMILDYGTYDPTIDTSYFPNTSSDVYWSSTTPVFQNDHAWAVGFNCCGDAFYYDKSYTWYVRAVRGEH